MLNVCMHNIVRSGAYSAYSVHGTSTHMYVWNLVSVQGRRKLAKGGVAIDRTVGLYVDLELLLTQTSYVAQQCNNHAFSLSSLSHRTPL